MKYRTKLYFAFASISFISSLIAICFVYFEGKHLLNTSFKRELQSVVSVAAGFIKGEEISQIKHREDVELPVYKKYYALLDTLQNELTAGGLEISHFYTVHRMKGLPDELYFGIDTAKDPQASLPPGLAYLASNKKEIEDNFGIPFSSTVPYFGTFGRWFSAFAPLVNGNKEVVGMLGIDVSAELYYKEINRLFTTHLFALLASLAASFLLAFLFSRRVTRSLHQLLDIVEQIAHGNFSPTIPKRMDGEFYDLSLDMEYIGKALSTRALIENNFSSYVSYPVLQSLLRSPPPLKGERRHITTLFGNLRDLSLMTPEISSEEIVAFLNIFFESMIETTFKFNGTLENFRGDGFLLIFGAPASDAAQEQHAVSAALEILETWHRLLSSDKLASWPPINIHLGVHSGEALTGGIGDAQNLHYTAIGTTVHIAQKIAIEASNLRIPLIISEETKNGLQEPIALEKLPNLTLPLLDSPLSLYQVKSQESNDGR